MGMGAAGYFVFLGLHILDLGGTEAQIGLAFSASAAAEIPIMFLGARWFARYDNATIDHHRSRHLQRQLVHRRADAVGSGRNRSGLSCWHRLWLFLGGGRRLRL